MPLCSAGFSTTGNYKNAPASFPSMHSPAFGAEHQKTLHACSPYVKACPDCWEPYAHRRLPTDGREAEASLTPYGSMIVAVGASDVVDAIHKAESRRRASVGLTPHEFEAEQTQLSELGITLKGRTLAPVHKPPTRQQLAAIIPSAGKSIAELYHGEMQLPKPVSVAEQLGIAPVPEPRPNRISSGRYLLFHIPAPALQLFCHWIRAHYSPKTTKKDLVSWAAASIQKYGRADFSTESDVPSAILERLYPVSYFSVLALLQQVFGPSAYRQTMNSFTQIMSEDLHWDHRALIGSEGHFTLWFPVAGSIVPEFTPAPIATNLLQF